MPLPAGGKTPWPPQHCQTVNRQLATWAAWYSGDAEQLQAVYGGDQATGAGGEFFASESGGFKPGVRKVVDAVRRWFWGTRNPTGQPRQRLHVPLAGDIAAASADLLFSEPPTVTVEHQPTQARLAELVDDGVHATLLEAAELAAAFGGVYLRVLWDRSLRDRPWPNAVHPDAAVPEWRQGALTAVTFWRVVAARGRMVWRHLERHEPGRILHGLYQGEQDELGTPVPLADQPELAALATVVDAQQAIATGHTGLTAVYVPNMRPNRVWRGSAYAAPLGRSDYAGVEPLMDALDQTWSSWMRDIELGKSRIIVPRAYMQNQGPGRGATVDLDQEVYEPVNTLGGDEKGLEIEQVQFSIRVEQHSQSVTELKTQIVASAGYSAQTFGLTGEVAATATEVAARERRSLITRDRKIRYWRPALAELLHALLAVDKAVFGSQVVPTRPAVEFADAVSVDPEAEARTLQTLHEAQAISTEQRVRRLHPDWDDPKVNAEVARILAETGQAVENPDTFTGGAPALPG
jgi:A118 family predicted phage portal protein